MSQRGCMYDYSVVATVWIFEVVLQTRIETHLRSDTIIGRRRARLWRFHPSFCTISWGTLAKCQADASKFIIIDHFLTTRASFIGARVALRHPEGRRRSWKIHEVEFPRWQPFFFSFPPPRDPSRADLCKYQVSVKMKSCGCMLSF